MESGSDPQQLEHAPRRVLERTGRLLDSDSDLDKMLDKLERSLVLAAALTELCEGSGAADPSCRELSLLLPVAEQPGHGI